MSMDQGPTTPTSPPSRPRPRSRGISNLSNRSGGSEGRERYAESPKDKARRDSLWKGLSKANPNAAINEEQPAVANVVEETTLHNLRDVQHKDTYGNEIVDPDLSNPTRPRMERPLDTIRSFERAIDDGYKRRSTYRQDAEQWDQNNQYASRRSSYFNGYENGPNPHRHTQGGGGYYGNQNGYYGGNRGPPNRTRYGDRMQSDPQIYSQRQQQQPQQPVYPQHAYQSSYDTVNTGGSDSTGPWANSTDPSSENSSIDRVTAALNKPQTPLESFPSYAPNGYNGPIMEEQGPSGYGNYPQQNGYGQQNGYAQRDGYGGQQQNGHAEQQQQQPQIYGPQQIYARHRQNSAPMSSQQPPQPQPSMNGGRRTIQKLNGPQAGGAPSYPGGDLPSNRREPEKRKSWLARKFSKKN